MPERAGHGSRVTGDQYFTTTDLARFITAHVAQRFGMRPGFVFEPGSGAGSFQEAATETFHGVPVVGYEVDALLVDYTRGRGFTTEHRDVLKATLPEADLIIGNPPFKLADDFIPACHSRLRPGG